MEVYVGNFLFVKKFNYATIKSILLIISPPLQLIFLIKDCWMVIKTYSWHVIYIFDKIMIWLFCCLTIHTFNHHIICAYNFIILKRQKRSNGKRNKKPIIFLIHYCVCFLLLLPLIFFPIHRHSVWRLGMNFSYHF